MGGWVSLRQIRLTIFGLSKLEVSKNIYRVKLPYHKYRYWYVEILIKYVSPVDRKDVLHHPPIKVPKKNLN